MTDLQTILVIDNAIIFMLWIRVIFLERKVGRIGDKSPRIALVKPKWMGK